MGLTRKELDKVYEEVKSRYRRKNRDLEIIEGIEVLYNALNDYIDGNYISAKNYIIANIIAKYSFKGCFSYYSSNNI